ncbi:polyadenylate-binding protein 2-like [Hibiscus syriacus]|uniref:polyadenylate-binding protein 2-like n=1 Tax=Hibiscus syriacus TaxID=106335 RepID=UPI0019247E7D|nr:polyadenylate-binding protein 2-like [Hibiscus syriacus]
MDRREDLGCVGLAALELSWVVKAVLRNPLKLTFKKKRLKEMEDEAAALREMQAKVEKEMVSVQDPTAAATSQANREEVDSRSIFVGNVDYSCTPEEVQQHFQSCGNVNRVTIRSDKYGQPKGYAYVEFLEAEVVQEALLLNESELRGRQLKEGSKVENGNTIQPLLLNTMDHSSCFKYF